MMARVLLGFCALGAADGLSLRSQHVLASNRTDRGHHSSLAFVESQVLATLESGAQAPFDDLLNLLSTMKKRYICEDASAGRKAGELTIRCDALATSLSDISDAEGRKLTTKTNECEAADNAVTAKKKQIEDSTAERKAANEKIPKYEQRIETGTGTDATAAKTFATQRDDTNGAIKLVKDMTEKSTTLTLVQITNKVESMPEGHAKDMGSLALLQMHEKTKGDNLDTNAYKALLGELATELAKYLKILTDTEGTRAGLWAKAKAGFEKDLKEAKDSVALQDSNLVTFGKELTSNESAQKQCAKELLIQQETTKQTALDATNKATECVTMKKSAKEAAEQRRNQLSTVDELLTMLANSNIADRVKEAVKALKASDVKDFKCSAENVLLDLSGGDYTASRSKYVSPAGATVTCSPTSYVNKIYYYVGYLFNGVTSGTRFVDDGSVTSIHSNYFLSSQSKKPATVRVQFGRPVTLGRIRVYPAGLRRTNDYRAAKYEAVGKRPDGSSVALIQKTGANNLGEGKSRWHEINSVVVTEVTFTLTKAEHAVYLGMGGIDFYEEQVSWK